MGRRFARAMSAGEMAGGGDWRLGPEREDKLVGGDGSRGTGFGGVGGRCSDTN